MTEEADSAKIPWSTTAVKAVVVERDSAATVVKKVKKCFPRADGHKP